MSTPPLRLLAVTYGVTIADLYYCQPLLPQMARSFGPSAGYLTAVGQLGYGLALVLVVPLGDIVRRRRLVGVLLGAEVAALAATAAAPTAEVLLIAGAVLGLTSAGVVNVLVPYAAGLAAPHERGRAMATMLTGGMTGVLLSRTVAGVVAEALGWRALFAIAALATAALLVVPARVMAPTPPETTIGYRAQLAATVRLAARDPLLRRRSYLGACAFAAFGALWATLSFQLAGPPYHYGQTTIGLLALAGAAGTLAARFVGRAADRGRERLLTRTAPALGIASFGALWMGGSSLSWLLLGLVAMDLAVQAVHLLNLSVLYGRADGARSRVASVYMTLYTLGGVVGAGVGTALYQAGGWTALCLLGAAVMTLGLTTALRLQTRETTPDTADPGHQDPGHHPDNRDQSHSRR
ncbi:MFS transporter [Actinomadura oligospora]|uniref:MFS transporter n=1 Tax=Actinomadura oligospora TaxID=111804 RepID=UPI001472AFCF|nr:MFS transporter [Actinomadura oligospora]